VIEQRLFCRLLTRSFREFDSALYARVAKDV
jgi:hypothetical protein